MIMYVPVACYTLYDSLILEPLGVNFQISTKPLSNRPFGQLTLIQANTAPIPNKLS